MVNDTASVSELYSDQKNNIIYTTYKLPEENLQAENMTREEKQVLSSNSYNSEYLKDCVQNVHDVPTNQMYDPDYEVLLFQLNNSQ